MGTERVIKRYTNRKLYDTDQSRYVTLDDIAKLIRDNEEVRVIDNETQDDLTSVTFAQIILEEEKRKTNLVSVPFLRKLIHSGEAAVQDLSDSAKRALDQLGDLTGRAGGRVREVVEEGGKAIDEAIDEGRSFIDELINLPQRRLESLRDVAFKQVDRIRQSPSLQREIERLEKSIHSIEQMLTKLRETEEHEAAAAAEGRGPAHTPEKKTEAIIVTEKTMVAGDVVITEISAEPVEIEGEPEEVHHHKPRASSGSRG
ncbi:MAG TPA: polyhydroxyalkanoate synthesis regulator DNA-binding domain-containing protein [Candidatus Limnocylindrales bacterium]|nr:polyhydroxyalkanoate synthesis regulator DNA-binding domain-containing protein [Candidatus Limnocylindrales bacterium]